MCLSFLLFVHATSVGQPACDAVRRTGIDAHDGVDGAAHPAHPPVSGLFGVAPNTLPERARGSVLRNLRTSYLCPMWALPVDRSYDGSRELAAVRY